MFSSVAAARRRRPLLSLRSFDRRRRAPRANGHLSVPSSVVSPHLRAEGYQAKNDEFTVPYEEWVAAQAVADEKKQRLSREREAELNEWRKGQREEEAAKAAEKAEKEAAKTAAKAEKEAAKAAKKAAKAEKEAAKAAKKAEKEAAKAAEKADKEAVKAAVKAEKEAQRTEGRLKKKQKTAV